MKPFKDNIFFALLVLCWAIQATAVLSALLSLWPALKWDMVLYLFFTVFALAAAKIVFKYFAKAVNYRLLIVEAVLAFLMVSALFKIMVYDNSPMLARHCLTVLIVVSLLSKVFYPECKKAARFFYQNLLAINWAPWANAWWVGLIVVMIYMPDVERMIATIFMGECLHHFDWFIMSVGYAGLWGQLPYVDLISQYGVGLPLLFAKFTHAIGPYDYVPLLSVMMWFVIIYFILTYFMVRYWLGSALIAGVAFLLVFRLQMFHYGVSPYIWCMPSASPIRFGLDIGWMWLLLLHLRIRQPGWLVFAALYSGFAPYYMTSTGMAVMASFYVYLLGLILVPGLRRQVLLGAVKRLWYWLCWVLPVVTAVLCFAATYKGYILQKEFWHNFLNYMIVFGHTGSIVMWESLKYRYFWAFFMSIMVPLTFMATFLYIGTCLYIEKAPLEWLFTAVLCVYGLANYEYYVVRAAATTYYVGVLPFVLVVCFWFTHVLSFLPAAWQRRTRAAAIMLGFYALLTNQNYLAYPNLLNFSRNPMTDNLVIQRFPDRRGYFNIEARTGTDHDRLAVNDLGASRDDMRIEDDFKDDAAMKDYFRAHFDFSRDAQLIRQLTGPRERVALISAFETRILMQADRPPFFYHFPILESRPMTFRTFPNAAAWVPSYVDDTIGEIRDRKPEYVFMEKVFLQDDLPPAYRQKRAKVIAVINYVRANYEPFEQGQYLVVMKRRN